MAIIVGIVVGVVLGLNLLNQAYAAIGEQLGVAVEPGIRPLVVGMVIVGAVGLIVGIFTAIRMNAAAGGRFVALAGMTVARRRARRVHRHHVRPEVGAGHRHRRSATSPGWP